MPPFSFLTSEPDEEGDDVDDVTGASGSGGAACLDRRDDVGCRGSGGCGGFEDAVKTKAKAEAEPKAGFPKPNQDTTYEIR
jgi:hypothetical protein